MYQTRHTNSNSIFTHKSERPWYWRPQKSNKRDAILKKHENIYTDNQARRQTIFVGGQLICLMPGHEEPYRNIQDTLNEPHTQLHAIKNSIQAALQKQNWWLWMMQWDMYYGPDVCWQLKDNIYQQQQYTKRTKVLYYYQKMAKHQAQKGHIISIYF